MNQVGRNTVLALAIISFCLVTAFPRSSYAQLRASRGSEGSLTAARLRGVGRTNLYNNTQYARNSYLNTPRATRQGGAYSALAGFQGRRADPVRAAGTRKFADPMRSTMAAYFGRSPSAFQFAIRPIFAGRVGVQMPLTPMFLDRNRQLMVRGAQMLAREQSYHYRVYLPLEGPRIRDDLTNTSLDNIPPPVDPETTARSRRSHSDLLAARLRATREKLLEQGWRRLKEGDYIRGRGAFGTAGVLGRDELAPRVGKLLCDVANEQYATVAVDMDAIIAHSDNIFDAHYPLNDVLTPEVAEGVLADFAAIVRASKDSDRIAAAHAYLLWLDGQRTAALNAAEKLRSDSRDSKYASFADQMRAQMKSEQEPTEVSSEGTS